MRKIKQIDDCGNTIAIYESISEAAAVQECDESSIRKVVDRVGRKSCGYIWKSEETTLMSAADTTEFLDKRLPKILFLDIETAPILAMVWQSEVWKARIGHDKIVSDWFMLSYSCKWLGSDEMISGRLTGEAALNEDDSSLITELWDMFDEADIVVAHNGDYFDIPNINARFIAYGLPPTSAYKQIDTLKVAQKQFGFTHNSLNALAAKFGIESKIETNFDLWKRCLRGEEEALEEMVIYNRHDVEILEAVYLVLRPWIKSHTNVSLYNEETEMQCAHCGSTKLHKAKFFYTNTGKYATYRCKECGAILRARKTMVSKTKEILVSIPGR